MAIIFHMPPWQPMWLYLLQCYHSYRAGILLTDLTSVECLYDNFYDFNS